jgi:TRAP-type C4-dicarboxylate transport system permease small subunit
MHNFTKVVQKISDKGIILGAVFLIVIILITVIGIISRLFGGNFMATYELIQVLIVVVVATTVGYTAMQKGHVAVKMFVSRFPQRIQGIIEIFNSIISICLWGGIAYTGGLLLLKRWMDEETEVLAVPVLPFRIIWLAGLIILCMVFITDLINSFGKVTKKWNQ